jgi:hypothetical protein
MSLWIESNPSTRSSDMKSSVVFCGMKNGFRAGIILAKCGIWDERRFLYKSSVDLVIRSAVSDVTWDCTT